MVNLIRILVIGWNCHMHQNDWINIGIKYPPYDKPVLVTDGNIIQIMTLRYKDGFKYWSAEYEVKRFIHVRYWMELPEAPKE